MTWSRGNMKFVSSVEREIVYFLLCSSASVLENRKGFQNPVEDMLPLRTESSKKVKI